MPDLVRNNKGVWAQDWQGAQVIVQKYPSGILKCWLAGIRQVKINVGCITLDTSRASYDLKINIVSLY